MEIVLAIATLLGGITAICFLWEKAARKDTKNQAAEDAISKALKVSKYYFIVSKVNGKCVEIEDAHFEDRAIAIQNVVNQKDNQKWEFMEVEPGYFKMLAKHRRKCLDVQGAMKDENRANVWQFNYHGGENQKWQLITVDDYHFFIKSKHSGKCLDVQAARRTEVGANVWQYSCHGGDNKLWRIVSEVYGVDD